MGFPYSLLERFSPVEDFMAEPEWALKPSKKSKKAKMAPSD